MRARSTHLELDFAWSLASYLQNFVVNEGLGGGNGWSENPRKLEKRAVTFLYIQVTQSIRGLTEKKKRPWPSAARLAQTVVRAQVCSLGTLGRRASLLRPPGAYWGLLLHLWFSFNYGLGFRV